MSRKEHWYRGVERWNGLVECQSCCIVTLLYARGASFAELVCKIGRIREVRFTQSF